MVRVRLQLVFWFIWINKSQSQMTSSNILSLQNRLINFTNADKPPPPTCEDDKQQSKITECDTTDLKILVMVVPIQLLEVNTLTRQVDLLTKVTLVWRDSRLAYADAGNTYLIWPRSNQKPWAPHVSFFNAIDFKTAQLTPPFIMSDNNGSCTITDKWRVQLPCHLVNELSEDHNHLECHYEMNLIKNTQTQPMILTSMFEHGGIEFSNELGTPKPWMMFQEKSHFEINDSVGEDGSVRFYFHVMRIPERYALSIRLPSVILGLASASSTFLPPKYGARLICQLLLLLAYCLLLQLLSDQENEIPFELKGSIFLILSCVWSFLTLNHSTWFVKRWTHLCNTRPALFLMWITGSPKLTDTEARHILTLNHRFIIAIDRLIGAIFTACMCSIIIIAAVQRSNSQHWRIDHDAMLDEQV